MMFSTSTVGLRGARALPAGQARPAAPRPAPRLRVAASAHSYNWNKALDKAHDGRALREIVDLPPSALQGMADRIDDLLAPLNIRSVKDLGAWKYYKAARAIQALAAVEVSRWRAGTALSPKPAAHFPPLLTCFRRRGPVPPTHGPTSTRS